MLDEQQVRAYAAADFSEPHGRFVALLKEKLPSLPSRGRALDLGCGAGDISLRFARVFGDWTVDAIDGSPVMLELGRRVAAEAGLASRVQFYELLLPTESPPHRDYALLFSNSLLHHLSDPEVLWSTLRCWAQSGSSIFVMDLLRPKSRAEAEALVERHAGGEPEVLRTDFLNSLLAAYRPTELRTQLEQARLGHLRLEVVSDRHFIAWGVDHEGRPAA
jgi:SAM-dependent methyltransferase